jgi:hypothetical protein
MKACSSERSPSLLSFANASRTSQSGGSLDNMPWWRVRTTPGFGGPAGTFSSACEGGAAESATESASSGVGGRIGVLGDNRVRTRLEEEGGGSSGRGLLDGGMFSKLDEAN